MELSKGIPDEIILGDKYKNNHHLAVVDYFRYGDNIDTLVKNYIQYGNIILQNNLQEEVENYMLVGDKIDDLIISYIKFGINVEKLTQIKLQQSTGYHLQQFARYNIDLFKYKISYQRTVEQNLDEFVDKLIA